jgi:arylsulfatase
MKMDPKETRDLAADPSHGETLEQLRQVLIKELYGTDLQWICDGRLAGMEAPAICPTPDRGLRGQRGLRFT